MKNLKKIASLLLALVLIFTLAFTGVNVYAEDTEHTVTITPNTMSLDELQPVTITVTGGLKATTSYRIALRGTSIRTIDESGFNTADIYNYTFEDGSVNPYFSKTTDENGGLTLTTDLHTSKITKTGTYVYCIMEDWSTVAVAIFEVTPGKAKLTLSTSEIGLGENETITATATGGEGGLAATTWYRVRLYKVTTPKASGIGVSPAFNNDYKFSNGLAYVEPSGITTDSNGGFTKELDAHITNVTETGYYAYAIMDKDTYQTVALIGFEVIVRPTITLSATSVELGAYAPVTLTVIGGKNGNGEITGLEANTQYKIRMAKSYNTPDQSGFNSAGLAGSYVGGTMVTTDENGGFEVTLSTHITNVTEVGKYTYAIMAKASEDATDYWSTKAVANFEVVEMGDHGHFTNATNEFYVGKSVKLTYENLDLTTYGTPEFKLYKWTEDWSFSANKTEFLSGSWKQLTSTSGTVTLSASQMEGFGGEGTYVAVINGTGYTKFTEFKFTYVPNPKGMTIENTTLYRGQSVRIDLYGAEEGDAVAIFANGIPAPYTILGGSYRVLTDGQETVWTDTSKLAPGEYTVGLWSSDWDFNGRINITIEKMDNDINYDAEVNIVDLVRLKKMTAEIVDLTDDADLNVDGDVDSLDITYLRRILLGLDPEIVELGDNEVVDTWDF